MNKKQSRYTKLFISTLLGITVISVTPITAKQSNMIHWDWKTINPLEVSFPQSFLWGTTTNAYEVEGNSINNTWYLWETETKKDGTPWAHERSAHSCDHWNRYKQDIKKMKQMGLTAYCFSLSWDKIEPFEGHFDANALQHYVDVCNELVHNNIKPVIIFKDYRDPIWFACKGGFEKVENISYFVRFCKTVFEQLHDKVDQWITFWSPEGYALNGHFRGDIPPGKKNMQCAAIVLKNILEAHVQTYQACKETEGVTAQIGITKHVYPIESWNNINPLDRVACWMTNKLMNEPIYNFFTTGTFSIKIPLVGPYYASVTHKNTYAPKTLDFVGINYHSHGYMNNFELMTNPDEIQTDIDIFSIYPEGLYEAVKEVSKNMAQQLAIPLYIIQNGIATTDASTQEFFLKRHLYALSKAINDGFDVRGYFYWTFMDCYSWGSYKMGLLTKEREDKEGAQYFIDLINNQQNR